MSNWNQTHQPCPCGESSDAYAVDAAGHGKCFSCGKDFWPESKQLDTEFTYQYITRRNITAETHQRFNVRARVSPDGVPTYVEYPHRNGGVKIKNLDPNAADRDRYRTTGDFTHERGWGPEYFPAASSRSITLFEGHDDAMAGWQMLGNYPVYSVQSASSAIRDVKADFEYLDSFERVYIAFDSDKPGQEAAKAVAAIFGYKKAYHVKLDPLKDATEYLEQKREKEFRNVWHNAARFTPEGVVNSLSAIKDIFAKAQKKQGVSTGFPTIDFMLRGGLQMGRAYLVSGLTGIGKTEFLRAIEYNVLKQNKDAVLGILHFEEDVNETIQRLAGYEIKQPCHLQDAPVPDDKVLTVYEELVGDVERVTYVRHFGSEDPDVILSKIRFLVAGCGCQYVFLDNITILGTGRVQDDERKELDYLSTQLEMLVKELQFCLVYISHENEQEGTRGSQNINKVCDVWINIKRDVKAENEYTRNVQTMTFFKNRQAGRTGPAGRYHYDDSTSVLSEISDDLPT